MKKKTCIVGGTLALLITACSSELTNTDLPGKQPSTPGPQITVTATWPDAVQTGADAPQTRLAYDFTPSDGSVNVTWKEKDYFYVGSNWTFDDAGLPVSDPNSSFQPFSLTGGKGTNAGTFSGNLPNGATDGTQLYAVYADGNLVQRRTMNNKEQLVLSYADQRQTANDNPDHLADYDLMWATTTYQSTSPTTAFQFQHAGAMVKFTLTLPQSKLTVKEVKLTTDDSQFTPFCMQQKLEKGKNEDGTTTLISEADKINAAVYLNLGDETKGLALSGNVLTAYMMMAPTTLSGEKIAGKNITLIVTDIYNRLYSVTLTGAAIEAGKYYTVTATLANTFEGGNGTLAAPYLISNAGQLRNLAMIVNSGITVPGETGKTNHYYDKHYKLSVISINLKNEEWTPIGKDYIGFKGSLSGAYAKGNKCTINNMSIKTDNTRDADYFGLFGNVNGGTVSDVVVKGEIKFQPNIASSRRHVGGIAGQLADGTISNCTNYCAITVHNNPDPQINVGGIVGYLIGASTLTNCVKEGSYPINATANKAYAGGIIGYLYNARSSMTNCTNSAKITAAGNGATHYAGSLIGFAEQSNTGVQVAFTIDGYTSAGSANEVLIGQYKFPDPNSKGNYILIKKTTDDTSTTLDSGTGSYPLIAKPGGGTGDYINDPENGGKL